MQPEIIQDYRFQLKKSQIDKKFPNLYSEIKEILKSGKNSDNIKFSIFKILCDFIGQNFCQKNGKKIKLKFFWNNFL